MYNNGNREKTFEIYPSLKLTELESTSGNTTIVEQLSEAINKIDGTKKVVVFDYYHGVNEMIILNDIITELKPTCLIDSAKAKYPEEIVQEKFGEYITDDRICGVFYWGGVDKFFDKSEISVLKEEIEKASGLIVIYGVGASVIWDNADVTVYCNLSLQTIKDRYKDGLDNWGAGNFDEEYLGKEKRFCYVERIMQDKHKRSLLVDKADFITDCNRDGDFVMGDRVNYDETMN